MKGTRINKRLDGACVKIIVLRRPMRLAMEAAARAEKPARKLAPQKMPPRTAGSA